MWPVRQQKTAPEDAEQKIGNEAIISFTPSFRRLSSIPGGAAVASRVFCRSPAVVERPVAFVFLFYTAVGSLLISLRRTYSCEDVIE